MIGSKAVSAARLRLVCDKIIAGVPKGEVVDIKATGEPLVNAYAEARGLHCENFSSDWKKHGNHAPYERAEDLVSNGDMLIAFLKDGDTETKFIINLADNKGIPTVINYV